MRHLSIGMVVFALTVLAPIWTLAGNQEVAEQIAANLRESGQLHDYKIGVKYQNGTAWLRGRVSSPEQMKTALKLVSQTAGVTRVVNNLEVSSGELAAETEASNRQTLKPMSGAIAPERLPRFASAAGSTNTPEAARQVGRADRVATSFTPAPAQRVAAIATPQPTLAAPLLATSNEPPQPVPARPAAPHPARPIPIAYTQPAGPMPMGQVGGGPIPQYVAPVGGVAPVRYDQPHLPAYAWPSYAAYPNYAALTYPKQYSPTAWPYIGPFYPYPQVPLGWRKVTLEWHDGWWQLDFDDGPRRAGFISGLFRPCR